MDDKIVVTVSVVGLGLAAYIYYLQNRNKNRRVVPSDISWKDYWQYYGFSRRNPLLEKIWKLVDLRSKKIELEYNDTLFLERMGKYIKEYGESHDVDKARHRDLERYLQQREGKGLKLDIAITQEEDDVKKEILQLQKERYQNREKWKETHPIEPIRDTSDLTDFFPENVDELERKIQKEKEEWSEFFSRYLLPDFK